MQRPLRAPVPHSCRCRLCGRLPNERHSPAHTDQAAGRIPARWSNPCALTIGKSTINHPQGKKYIARLYLSEPGQLQTFRTLFPAGCTVQTTHPNGQQVQTPYHPLKQCTEQLSEHNTLLHMHIPLLVSLLLPPALDRISITYFNPSFVSCLVPRLVHVCSLEHSSCIHDCLGLFVGAEPGLRSNYHLHPLSQISFSSLQLPHSNSEFCLLPVHQSSPLYFSAFFSFFNTDTFLLPPLQASCLLNIRVPKGGFLNNSTGKLIFSASDSQSLDNANGRTSIMTAVDEFSTRNFIHPSAQYQPVLIALEMDRGNNPRLVLDAPLEIAIMIAVTGLEVRGGLYCPDLASVVNELDLNNDFRTVPKAKPSLP